jgi:transketolase N-terminal domain/subunit
MIGNGELQKGMIWETAHIAPRYKLGNLTASLDSNGLQQFERQQDCISRTNRVTKEAVVTWPMSRRLWNNLIATLRPVLLRAT